MKKQEEGRWNKQTVSNATKPSQAIRCVSIEIKKPRFWRLVCDITIKVDVGIDAADRPGGFHSIRCP
jgi:hypothetical protein